MSEMGNILPRLTKLRSLLETYEAYYSLLTGTSASDKNMAEILWASVHGSMIGLKNHRYSEDEVGKARDFVHKWLDLWKKSLLDSTFQEVLELQRRLEMLYEYKHNSEDPLGW